MIQAPLADQFPAYPHSWYLFCTAREIQRRPVSRSMLGGQFVAFRTASGRLALMDGRCGHLGSDLGQGCVKGEAIQCPFHHWEYGPSGQCTHIPATTDIPAWARQACYPVQERHGCVFFFNRPEALYPLPFFDQVSPDELSAIRAAHDRRLVGLPAVDCPAPFARRATARFAVAGDSLRDRVTRWAAGDEVEMSITDWCGNLMFATATFRRTTSYGLVVTEPLPAGGAWVRVIVFVRKSASWLGRICRDALRLEVSRWFIKKFLSADAPRLDGAHYNPHGLIEADHDLAEYFQWLAHVSHGTPNQQWRSTGLVPTMQPTAPA
jgi:nitrite reductase/ring-hydroxylating ferredoxin subunit